jgi:hypothetical protein
MDNITTTLLEILKYTLPALVVLMTSYLIVQKFLVAQNQRKQLALFKDAQDITLRLRLQAYERLVVFIERISPRHLIPRIYDPSMTVRDLQAAITFNIRAEFEHNLSQQIYVSPNVWETVKNVKEQEINMANQMGKALDPDGPGKELNTRIMEMLQNVNEQLPTDIALEIINNEVRAVMTNSAALGG